jgi:hypothetical protein
MYLILRTDKSAEDGGQKYLQGTWNRELQGTGYKNVYRKQGNLRTERIGYRKTYRGLRTEIFKAH